MVDNVKSAYAKVCPDTVLPVTHEVRLTVLGENLSQISCGQL
jgi:hypothetical protein